jgi:hypothetical protein
MEIAGNTKWQSPPTRAASSADDDDSIVASDSAQAAICKRLAVAKMNPMVMAPFLEAFVLSKSDSNGEPEMPPHNHVRSHRRYRTAVILVCLVRPTETGYEGSASS